MQKRWSLHVPYKNVVGEKVHMYKINNSISIEGKGWALKLAIPTMFHPLNLPSFTDPSFIL